MLVFCSTMTLCIKCLEMRTPINCISSNQTSFQEPLSDHKPCSCRFTVPLWKKNASRTRTLYLEQIVMWPNYDFMSSGNPHVCQTWTKVQNWIECISHLTFLPTFYCQRQPVLFICLVMARQFLLWPLTCHLGPVKSLWSHDCRWTFLQTGFAKSFIVSKCPTAGRNHCVGCPGLLGWCDIGDSHIQTTALRRCTWTFFLRLWRFSVTQLILGEVGATQPALLIFEAFQKGFFRSDHKEVWLG